MSRTFHCNFPVLTAIESSSNVAAIAVPATVIPLIAVVVVLALLILLLVYYFHKKLELSKHKPSDVDNDVVLNKEAEEELEEDTKVWSLVWIFVSL